MAKKSSAARAAETGYKRKEMGLLAIGSNLPVIAEPSARRRGFTQVRIVTEWPAIVGEAIAAHTIPEQLVFRSGDRSNGVLHIRVTPGLAVKIQHISHHIIERVNTYFGYGAVHELRYTQGPIDPLRPRRANLARRAGPPQQLTEEEESELEQLLAKVGDAPLRDSLRRLGKAIHVRKSVRN